MREELFLASLGRDLLGVLHNFGVKQPFNRLVGGQLVGFLFLGGHDNEI